MELGVLLGIVLVHDFYQVQCEKDRLAGLFDVERKQLERQHDRDVEQLRRGLVLPEELVTRQSAEQVLVCSCCHGNCCEWLTTFVCQQELVDESVA